MKKSSWKNRDNPHHLAQEMFQAMRPHCNCGGPQMGTDHSPDCEYVLAWDRAVATARDEHYQFLVETGAA